MSEDAFPGLPENMRDRAKQLKELGFTIFFNDGTMPGRYSRKNRNYYNIPPDRLEMFEHDLEDGLVRWLAIDTWRPDVKKQVDPLIDLLGIDKRFMQSWNDVTGRNGPLDRLAERLSIPREQIRIPLVQELFVAAHVVR